MPRTPGACARLSRLTIRERGLLRQQGAIESKVLRLFNDCGLKVEVNSGGELFRARLSGFPPSAIVFNGVGKSVLEICEALSPPILSINVDSLFELGRIAETASAMNVTAQIALRVVPGSTARLRRVTGRGRTRPSSVSAPMSWRTR